MNPHVRISAPCPTRSIRPMTISATDQPTKSRIATSGMSASPRLVIWNANAASATIDTDGDADRQLGQPEQRDSRAVLELGHRRDHEVQQVARPRLLEEAGRDAHLGLEHDVEEDDPGEQERSSWQPRCRSAAPK